MKNIVLEIKNVSKKYGRKKVIDNLSLEVEAGQIYGFLGPNGAGKTTTIKMIVGLISIDEGSILINGADVKKEHEKAMQSVGAIVENPDLYGYLSGLDNIKLYARIHNVSKERINEVIEFVDLKERINDKVRKYSLGMKQRLGLAISLIHKPKLLILDEPTNGLDPAGIRKLRDTLKHLAHKENVAIFVSSHLLSEMQLMCDKVAIIDKGKIVKVENINEYEENKENKYIFDISDIEKGKEILKDVCKCSVNDKLLVVEYEKNIMDIVKLLNDNGIEISSFSNKVNTLEEEFLKITGGKD